MKYEIKFKYKDKIYEVIETTTDQVIEVYTDVFSAQKATTHFNRGGGFDGWTPSFILQK